MSYNHVEYMREYHRKNHEADMERQRKWRAANREKRNSLDLALYHKLPEEKKKQKAKRNMELYHQRYIDFLADKECCVCGENRHYLLDFHHLNPAEKEHDVSRLIKGAKKERIEKELAKCVILCANCHREVHYLMRNEGKDEQIPSL